MNSRGPPDAVRYTLYFLLSRATARNTQLPERVQIELVYKMDIKIYVSPFFKNSISNTNQNNFFNRDKLYLLVLIVRVTDCAGLKCRIFSYPEIMQE